MTAKEVLALHTAPAERLRHVVMRAEQLEAECKLHLDDNEGLLRAVAQMSGARVWGVVSIDGLRETARVCWTAVAQHDRVRVTASFARPATLEEVKAVEDWDEWSSSARSGVLNALVEVPR